MLHANLGWLGTVKAEAPGIVGAACSALGSQGLTPARSPDSIPGASEALS